MGNSRVELAAVTSAHPADPRVDCATAYPSNLNPRTRERRGAHATRLAFGLNWRLDISGLIGWVPSLRILCQESTAFRTGRDAATRWRPLPENMIPTSRLAFCLFVYGGPGDVCAKTSGRSCRVTRGSVFRAAARRQSRWNLVCRIMAASRLAP